MTAGTVALAILMAITAAIPVVNFYVLGWLLDVSARVSRGRVRDGFWLWGAAPRLGTIFLALWAFLLPIRVIAGIARDARIIDPAAPATVALAVAVKLMAIVVAGHLLIALARGGRPGDFLRPLRNLIWIVRGGLGRDERGRSWLERSHRELAHLVDWLQFPRLWWLGVRGFFGALAWLAIPTAMYAAARQTEGLAMLITILGGALLVPVLCRLPFLQARFAVESKLVAYWTFRDTGRLGTFAPWSGLLAVTVLYVLTLPLYLMKIVLPPRDAMWLATIVFVVSIFPTRLLTGWAYGRAVRRRDAGLPRAPWWSRWPARLVAIALVAAYVLILRFTPYISEHGRGVLFEQHAFLLPWPL